MAEKRRSELARRLDTAAARSGLTNEQIGERLGVTGGNVSHWRTGRHRPDVETVQRFAVVVGASDYELLTGREDPSQVVEGYREARRRWQQAVAAGEEPGAAWEAVLGQEALLTPEERQVLQKQQEALARYVISVDGAHWIELSGEEHRIVRDLVHLLAHRRL